MSTTPPQHQPKSTPQRVSEAQTVTAAILSKDGRILIARRPAADQLANHWEFPGGKLEPGETPETCLARELLEELGIEVSVGMFLGENLFRYPHGTIRLLAYLTSWVAGELKPLVHDEIRWVSLEELGRYTFAPADVPFVEQILGGQWAISEG